MTSHTLCMCTVSPRCGFSCEIPRYFFQKTFVRKVSIECFSMVSAPHVESSYDDANFVGVYTICRTVRTEIPGNFCECPRESVDMILMKTFCRNICRQCFSPPDGLACEDHVFGCAVTCFVELWEAGGKKRDLAAGSNGRTSPRQSSF